MATIAGRIGTDERIGRLSPVEAAMLAELGTKPLAPVIRINTQSRYQRDLADIEAARTAFIEKRTAELLADRQEFGCMLAELFDGELEDVATIALRDAVEQQGQCWDGISTFGDLMHNIARTRAASEWPDELLKLAPPCSECQHGEKMRDAYGTGDSPTLYDCKPLAGCPWGKEQ